MPSVTPARPKGKESPRLWTRPLRKLTRSTSLGFECVDFAENVLGMKLLPWQRWHLIHALEVVGPIADRNLRFRTVLTLVGRQCGKTTLVQLVSLWMMNMGMVRLVLGAAQSLDIAREAWAGAVEIMESDPELSREIAPNGVRRTNGDHCLTLTNGARYRITAATRGAGRGLPVGLLNLDEIREHRDFLAWAALSKTINAQPNGLILAISNAGDDYSVVLNQLRDRALGLLEDPTATLGLFEWSAPDGASLDDWEAIAQGTPALGYTVPYAAIESALSTDPPGVFRTEIMCQKVESLDTPIAPMTWEACADPAQTIADEKWLHFCLDVAPGGEHATLAAAALGEDGRVKVAIVADWKDAGQIRDELPGLLAEVKPRSLGWFPNGPAAAVLTDLNTLKGVKRVQLTASDVPAVCQAFAEFTTARLLIHPNDALLNAHVLGSRRLAVGDGWRFARRGGNADAAYAAAGAVHLARQAGRPKALRLITAKTG